MAVPTSGPLSQLKLAREAKHADYNGSQSMGTISLYDLVNGGQANGSTVDYPAVNQGCLPNPANRGSYVQILQVYKKDGSTITGPFTHYLNPSQAATPSDMANGDTIYTDADLTTTVPAHGSAGTNSAYWYQLNTGLTTSQIICEFFGSWDTNSSGVITNFNCGQP